MAITVTHTTQATGTDAGNGEIGKAAWNEAHTIDVGAGRLIGNSTGSAGSAEEISVGSGLSLSGGVLATSGVVQSTDVATIEQVTQAEYDALTPPDANTLYVIVG